MQTMTERRATAASDGSPGDEPQLPDPRVAAEKSMIAQMKTLRAAHPRGMYTPAPQGMMDQMVLNGLGDMKMAFRYCDEKNRGFLERDAARRFLRCIGWCLMDHELDLMLDRAKRKVSSNKGHKKTIKEPSMTDGETKTTFGGTAEDNASATQVGSSESKGKEKLPDELMHLFIQKFKAASYTTGGAKLDDKFFNWLDKDGSGYLTYDEMRRIVRATLKLPPSAFEDRHVQILCEQLDVDGNGVRIEELMLVTGLKSYAQGQDPQTDQVEKATSDANAGEWDLPILVKIVSESQDVVNSSIEELQTSLRSLAGNNPRMSKTRILEKTLANSAFADNPLYVKEILEAVGAQSSTTIDCDTLAISIMKMIAQPQSLTGTGELQGDA